MKISVALKDVQRIYIETAPLIYYVETNATYIDCMDIIIGMIENTSMEAVSAVITLTEVLVHPMKLNNTELERQYRTLLINNLDFQLIPITSHIATSAAKLRARYGLRTPDALHIATAIGSGCDAFLTNDKDIKRVEEIAILVLDDLEVDFE